MRPSDRDAVLELCAGIWEGHDYIPEVFDRWVSDPSAEFQAAEVDGVIAGLQRLRVIAPGLVWYEGLRVAASHRRQGIARRMLDEAIRWSTERGLTEMRLSTREGITPALFEGAGFRSLVEAEAWDASRVEGGDPPRIPSPAEAESLHDWVMNDPALSAYGGVIADGNGALDVSREELVSQAERGTLRVGPGGRAMAVVRPGWGGASIWVTFLAGAGGALQELLTALRYEADGADLRGATVLAPAGHPALGDLSAVGYALRRDSFRLYIYARRLGAEAVT